VGKLWTNYYIEDTKGVIRSRNSMDGQSNGYMNKGKWKTNNLWSTKHYTENRRL